MILIIVISRNSGSADCGMQTPDWQNTTLLLADPSRHITHRNRLALRLGRLPSPTQCLRSKTGSTSGTH